MTVRNSSSLPPSSNFLALQKPPHVASHDERAVWGSSAKHAYLLCHIDVRLNIKRRARIEEIERENGWTDDDVKKEKDHRAFADMTDKQ
jgi:hypothetical protein